MLSKTDQAKIQRIASKGVHLLADSDTLHLDCQGGKKPSEQIVAKVDKVEGFF